MRRCILISPCLLLLGSLACQHRVYVSSVPAGASLSIEGEVVGTTPQELVVDWRLGRSTMLVAEVQDYRDVEVDLAKALHLRRVLGDVLLLRWGRLSGNTVRSHHELLFVREHGPSGTWSAEDARRN